MVKEMTRNQLPDGVLVYGYFGFGLGVQVQLSDWGDKGHVGEYGWSVQPVPISGFHLRMTRLSLRLPTRAFQPRLKDTIKADIYRAIE